jgi:hypothetical protein
MMVTFWFFLHGISWNKYLMLQNGIFDSTVISIAQLFYFLDGTCAKIEVFK